MIIIQPIIILYCLYLFVLIWALWVGPRVLYKGHIFVPMNLNPCLGYTSAVWPLFNAFPLIFSDYGEMNLCCAGEVAYVEKQRRASSFQSWGHLTNAAPDPASFCPGRRSRTSLWGETTVICDL